MDSKMYGKEKNQQKIIEKLSYVPIKVHSFFNIENFVFLLKICYSLSMS